MCSHMIQSSSYICIFLVDSVLSSKKKRKEEKKNKACLATVIFPQRALGEYRVWLPFENLEVTFKVLWILPPSFSSQKETCKTRADVTDDSWVNLSSPHRVSTPRTGGKQRHLISLFLSTTNKPSPTAAVIAVATPTSTNTTASIFFRFLHHLWRLLVRKRTKGLFESRKMMRTDEPARLSQFLDLTE